MTNSHLFSGCWGRSNTAWHGGIDLWTFYSPLLGYNGSLRHYLVFFRLLSFYPPTGQAFGLVRRALCVFSGLLLVHILVQAGDQFNSINFVLAWRCVDSLLSIWPVELNHCISRLN
ncbi:Uncharacterized protein HZ326_26459 [Fusarium oxysporum f. sp. albedinis]|nr:Uncharacterized protein HZ326_26459 [Fusarium oxysporum f. sp. albedinis]